MPALRLRAARGPDVTRVVLRGAAALALTAAALGVSTVGASAAPTGPTPDPSLGVVVIGAGGLQWRDVDRTDTPTLWGMVATGSVGSISVRTADPRKCPLEAWSTISAGRRWAAAPEADATDGARPVAGSPDDSSAANDCAALPRVVATDEAATGPSPHVVDGWSALVPAAADGLEPTSVTPGTLAARIAAVGGCTTAAGPGAALALADADGRVDRYVASPGELTRSDLAACRVVVVDTGELGDDRSDRRDALRTLDATVGRLVGEVPDGWRVVVAGVSDSPTTEEGLPFVVDWQQGGRVGWLTSESTRTAGIVTLTDLTATMVDTVGGDLTDFDGTPLQVAEDRRMSAERTVENRRYLTEMTTTVTHVMPVFVVVVVLAALAAGLALARHRTSGRPGPLTRRIAPAVLLLVASAPAGAFAAALSRWWVSSAPLVGAAVSAAVGTVIFALVAWFGSRALPAGRWRLAGASAGLTWLLLSADGLTGTQLQQGSILGSTPTFGARFYGFGNLAFSVYASSALVLAGFLAAAAVQLGRRRLAPVLVLVVGAITITLDGWPGFGADVGGILALVPGFVVLALGVGGMRLTIRRVLAGCALGIFATAAVGVVDWIGPWQLSHLGRFVQRVVDGDALPVIAGKAAGAWATVANPAGVLATLACLWAVAVLVGPGRWRPAAVRQAYASWSMLRPVVGSVVVAGTVGTLLNDSGIAVGVVVLGLTAVILTASATTNVWAAVYRASADGPSGAAGDDGPARSDALVRRMPAVLLATGGAMLALLLLGVGFAPFPVTAAGDVTGGDGTPVAAPGAPIVVVGTSGLRWQDASPAATPTLWGMVRDGAAVGGVAPGITGPNGRCASAGWLALAAGKPPLTSEVIDGVRACSAWSIAPDSGTGSASAVGASITGWSSLVDLQAGSALRPRLGVLAGSIAGAGACTTAVGPGAALALAATDGRVERYLALDDALTDPAGTFACPVTLVDLGSVPYQDPTEAVDPAPDPAAPAPTSDGPARAEALTALDTNLRRLLAAVPSGTSVLLVDVGNPARAAISLGVGVAQMTNATGAHFLSTPSTRWEGVVRLLDVPTTLLAAVGAGNPADLTGSPLNAVGPRTTDTANVVDQLVDLSVRDQALRGRSTSVTTVPFLVALAAFGLAVVLLPWLARRRPPVARRVRSALDVAFLLLASLPAGAFLMTVWSWWRADSPTTAMWFALAASTVIVAGLGALAPWRPIWAAPALVSAVTFALLTADAAMGTPLHRGSPLGPAPTLGGRYYGFGNPTYSVYAVVALVAAAGLSSALLARGRRRLAVVVSGSVALVALAVDLLPSLGADVGGGLVLLPAAAVVVLAVASARTTWRRLGLIGVVGVAAVVVIGVLDWLRPAAERSHLGRFVQSAIDGTALATVARKAGYAVSTVTSGPVAWITLAVLIAVAVLLWRRSRVRAHWFDALDEDWPLARPVVLGLLIAAAGGSIANDYGTRIATGLFAVAIPMVGLLVVRSASRSHDPPSR